MSMTNADANTNSNEGGDWHRRRFIGHQRFISLSHSNSSVLTTPFLVLLGLLLLAVAIQFSIVFTWFHNRHDENVLVLGISKIGSEGKLPQMRRVKNADVLHNEQQQEPQLLKYAGIIPNVSNTSAAADSVGKHNKHLMKHEEDVSSSIHHNTTVAAEDVNTHNTKSTPKILNAVIHIGPYKTATTSIQTYSGRLYQNLAQDGYEMPWKHLQLQLKKLGKDATKRKIPEWWCKQMYFALCFYQSVPTHRMKKESAEECNRELFNAGVEISQKNHNSLLVSAEQFSNVEIEGVEKLHEYLSNRWDNVTIVAAYRRYYEWIVSFYNERQKDVIFNDAISANKTDRLLPSLYHELRFNSVFNEEIRHKYTLSAVSRYQMYFENVVVMNYHDKSKSILERFYCDVLPGAIETCRKLKSIKVSKSINTSHSRVYEELAYAAHRRGMINIKEKLNAKSVVESRRQHNIKKKSNAELVQESICQHQEKILNLTSYDFPRKCLPDDILNEIWSTSLEAEKKFGGDEVDESTMKDEFDKYSKTSFCELDLDAILHSPLWVKFFQDQNQKLQVGGSMRHKILYDTDWHGGNLPPSVARS